MNRARLGRYALWQFRDYALHRGLPTLIIGSLFMLQLGVLGRRTLGSIPPDMAQRLVSGVLAPFVLIASLIAINGIISNDRKQGYFRFLFAKPVSIARYYGQAFALHGLGVIIATALFLLAIRLIAELQISAWALLYPAMYYVLLGGIGFLFSSFLRNDWIPIAAVIAISALANVRYGEETGIRGWVVRWVLPPFRMSDEIRNALLTGSVPDLWPAVWPIIYGLMALVGGVLVLRRKAMG